jgi:flagellar biosynthesis/type III secretory pathway protein FliH
VSSLRRLTTPVVVSQPRVLGAPDPVLDEATRSVVEQLCADAYQRGCADGAARASAQAEAAATSLIAVVQRVDAELHTVAARADIELALRIAAAVLDREPADDTVQLLGRIESAMAGIDDDPLVVHVSAKDLEPIATGVTAWSANHGTQVQVVADPAVAPGEARVSGRWGHADLTRQGAWEAVAGVLQEVAT